MGTRTVSQTINLQTPDQTSKYISADDSGLMVYDGREGAQTPSNPSATTNNVFIDENSLDIRKGTDVLATFGTDEAQIGQTGESHLEMDYHSMQLKDKEANAYFYVSDLRDRSGFATLTEYFDATASMDYPLSIYPVNSIDSVTVDGVLQTEGTDYTLVHDYSTDPYIVRFTYSLTVGAKIVVQYKTTSSDAKAYTLGVRRSGETVGPFSCAEGRKISARGYASHAEGNLTSANGIYAHAEGMLTTADGFCSHAEGYYTTAGFHGHAEGYITKAGNHSHAEGANTTASGFYSHAEGVSTTASGSSSHTQNRYTVATEDNQTVIGKYNKATVSGSGPSAVYTDVGDYAFIIGNGSGNTTAKRSNALTVDWDGNVEMALDTSSASGVDYEIYTALQTLGWDSDVIV